MKAEAGVEKKKRRVLALSLALFLFAIYLFTYRGGFHSIDEVSMFAVTESLVKFGRLNTNQIAWTQWTTSQAEAQGFFGTDGDVYSKKGLALSLAQAPLYLLALLLPNLGMLQTVSLLNAAITSLTGMLVFMFVHRLNFSLLTSAVTALTFGLATIALVYAKYLFSEPLAAFLLLLAAYMLYAYRQEGGLRHVVIAGLAAGLAVTARANNLFLLPVFGLYLLWVEYLHQSPLTRQGFTLRPFIKIIIAFGLALAVPALIILFYNYLRSGNPLQTGYDLTLFSSNALLGLYKLLFSPLRGLFIYSPVLLLTLPGWWLFRKSHPAEAWLFLGLAGITLGLFSFWSSGEGLSWGSRFLVPLIPFFAICLAPIIQKISHPQSPHPNPHIPIPTSHIAFYALLTLSFAIQILGVAVNPWVFLAQVQTEFGGEFFLEKTAALYDFSYSQIAGQLQAWSVANSDIIWWQPWGFDAVAFSLSLALVCLAGWLLWQQLANAPRNTSPIPHFLLPATLIATLIITFFLLTRYYKTDQQFGPADDAYTQALNSIAAQNTPGTPIITVAQYHYHVPMNRFKARVPLTGLAQQVEPLPETALPLLTQATAGPDSWLITIGFSPAAPDNAAEQWLTRNAYKISDEWLPNNVRRVHFSTIPPASTRTIKASLAGEIELEKIKLLDAVQPGQTLPVEFVWTALSMPQADYNLFLQLLKSDGAVAAQHDNPPGGATSGWAASQQITSRHALALPAALTPGDYRLIAGLYNPATGQRLPTATGTDFVELGNITIVETEAE